MPAALPTVWLNVEAANVRFTIRVNDFAAATEHEGGHQNFRLPINHLLIGGKAEISCQLRPGEGHTLLSDDTLFFCDIRQEDAGGETILWPGYRLTAAAHNTPATIAQGALAAPAAAVPTLLADLPVLDIQGPAVQQMMRAYQALWQQFSIGNLEALMDTFALREKIFADAYGEPLAERADRSRNIYRTCISDPGYRLFDWSPQHFQPRVDAYGRLLSLQDPDGNHPIIFLKSAGTFVTIPVYFGRHEDRLVPILG